MPDSPGFVFRDLQDRTVVLTGAARGIGRGLTPALLAQGLNLLLVDRDREPLEQAVAELDAAPGRVTTFVCDLADPEQRNRLAAELKATAPTIDGVIHNAGIDPRMPLDRMSIEFFRNVVATNVEPAVDLTRELLPRLRASSAGRVILIGSITFDIGTALLSAYVASKGAVVGLTRALAHELGPEGITVNCIQPGSIVVERERELHTEDTDRIVMEGQSLQRRLVPQDLAGPICLLLSDAGEGISGQVISVDGGHVHPWATSSTQEHMVDE